MLFVDPNLTQEQQRRAYGRIYEDWAALLKLPAWEQMQKYLSDEEDRLMIGLKDIRTGEESLRAVATLATLRAVRQLPQKTVEIAALALKQLTK